MKRFEEWPDDLEFNGYCMSCVPFFSVQPPPISCLPTASDLTSFDITVDVSCVDEGVDGGKEFRGNALEREKVPMNLGAFATGVESLRLKGKGSHWTHNTGLNLYLSQASVFASSLSKEEVVIPGFSGMAFAALGPQQLVSANIWLNLFPSQASLHYDGDHNLLIVTQGSKTVRLISPEYSHCLQPFPAYSQSSSNHSQLQSHDVTAEALRSSDIPFFEVVLANGNVLFIPEGWWHTVESSEATMAVNFWFLGPWGRMFRDAPHMKEYVLRSSFNSIVAARKDKFDEGERVVRLIEKVDFLSFERKGLELHQLLTAKRMNCAETSVTEDEFFGFTGNLKILASFWLRFAQKFPIEWTDILLSVGVKNAVVLTASWEKLDANESQYFPLGRTKHLEDMAMIEDASSDEICNSAEEFFARILTIPCRESVSEVRKHLLLCGERHHESFALRVAADVLGVERFTFGDT